MKDQNNKITLCSGYQNGLVGWIAQQHGQAYQEKWNFGQFFECKVARQLCDFLDKYQPLNSQIWSLVQDGQILGSITLDGSHALTDGAHLRWFILDPSLKGQGYGKRLLQTAVAFAKERNFPSIYLWTLAGLEPAGTLYRSMGFELEESKLDDQWGMHTQEEKLRLIL
ncbi:MAG: GNAT family N-acetyltransferase [Methylocystaceae bacterium]|nr:GNAT family N-acetyltransferase [Methylocystaceae bacterium]